MGPAPVPMCAFSVAADSVLALTIRDRRDYAMHDGKIVCANAEKAAGAALITLRALQK